MYDIIIPVSAKHIAQLQVNINFIKKNLMFNKIKIICSKELFDKFYLTSDIELIDENLVSGKYGIEKPSIKKIKDIMIIKNANTSRAGWYFQQFLKMYYAFISENRFYLIWDADTIPLRKIEFFSADGTKMLFNRKKEHHIPYFEIMDILFNKNLVYEKESFISEGMIIEVSIMKELIYTIEKNNSLKGSDWIEKIMYAIPYNNINYSGFSEFECYGTYLINKYPEKYKYRPLKTLRHGMSEYGKILSISELNNIKDLDTITFENWDKKTFLGIIKKKLLYVKKILNL